MSKYTRSIMSILQENAGVNDISTVDGIYTVANSVLFPQDALNVVDDIYRKPLVVGFAKHYFLDEIGLETLPLWKIFLSEKLYNYGSYINSIYSNIDKQVFADYRVSKVNKTIENTNSGTSSTSVVGTNGNTTNINGTDTNTYTESNNRDLVSDATGGGTIVNAKTGNDSTANTGTDVMAHTGTQAVDDVSSQTTHNTGTTENDNNEIGIVFDTPQGSLTNMRTPGGAAKGTGVNYVVGQTYNYMTGASEKDTSNVITDDTTSATTGTDTNTTTFNDTNTQTLDLDTTVTYDSTDTQTRDTTDGIVTSDDNVKTGSNSNVNANTIASTGTKTDTVTGATGSTGTVSDAEDVTDYSINWDMLYKSMPLLNKLWDVFDDLFMGIY